MGRDPEPEFFTTWPGFTIDLTDPQHPEQPSICKLEEYLGEKYNQFSAVDYKEGQWTSDAYGTFTCRSVSDGRDEAVVKIYMQIPYAGSEYFIHGERARQATITLTGHARREIEPIQTLTRNKCTATPHIQSYKVTTQGDDGTVPGGFLHYVLMGKAPGIQLHKSVFWGFESEERDRIREAFKEARRECIRGGICPDQFNTHHLFWNPEVGTGKIVIAGGWRGTRAAVPEDEEWNEDEYECWKLVDTEIVKKIIWREWKPWYTKWIY